MLNHRPIKSIRLLLATDEATVVDAVRGALQTADLRVDLHVVGSLHDYREAVAAGAPGLVLLDLHLRESGVETVLTSPPESGAFPILVLVDQDQEILALAALEVGALDYLVKSDESLASLPHSVRRAMREWNLRLDRRRAEEELRQSERKFRMLAEQLPDLVWQKDPDGIYISCNRRYGEAVGALPDAIAGHRDEDFYPPELAARYLADDRQVMATGKALDVEECGRHRVGARWFHTRKVSVLDEQGRCAGTIGIARDITQRKQAAEDLRHAHEQLSVLLESLPVAVYRCQADGDFEATFMTPTVIAVTGYPPERFTVDPTFWAKQIHPDDAPGVFAALSQVLVKGVCEHEYRWRDAEGTYRWMFDSLRLVRRPDGTPDHLVGMWQDITQRKEAEDTLRQSERRLRSLVEGLPDGAVYIEKDAIWLNASAERITGYTNAEIKTVESWFQLLYRVDAARTREFYEGERAAGFPAPSVVTLRRKDDQPRWVEFTAYRHEHGEVWLLHDVTDRKRAEEQLQASLQAKDALLKEVHHRVKNNLQIVCSLLNLQTEGLQSEAAVAALRDTQNRVRAMALLHETLYQAGNLAQVKFAWYVDNLCSHLRRSLGMGDGRIQLDLRVADVALTMEHAVPLGLIINELFSNAVKHAFPDGRSGRLVLELLEAADQLLLRVADDGVGLPSDFDVWQSRSLGLRLVFGLAEQLGGQAELKRDRGTVFQLTFPGAVHEA